MIFIPKYLKETFTVQENFADGSYGDFLISRHFYRIRDRMEYIKKNDELSYFYFKARKRFLKNFKKKNGYLYCQYCGKGPLKADAGNIFSTLPMATIDHVIPLSKGGKRFDADNMACSCERCNRKKADKL